MKKIIVSTVALTLMAAPGFASPLTDYSEGKVAVDIAIQSPSINDNFYSSPMDGKNALHYGITAGLGNHFAIQFKNSSSKTKDYGVDVLGMTQVYNEKFDVNEYNVLYQFNKNVSALAGVVQVKGHYSDNYPSSDSTNQKNIFQVGLVGSVPIADKTDAYTTIAFGKDTTAWTLGVSYKLTKNVDFDLFYGYNTYKNLEWQLSSQSNVTLKGMGYGLTYKF